MKNLTDEIQAVFAAHSLSEKQSAMLNLIENSHAKKDTKVKMRQQVSKITTAIKMDSFAANYAMSGEGMKVI